MTHMKKFQDIIMSKSMRGLCKEEDYTFLAMTEKNPEGAVEGALEKDCRDRKEDRVRRRLEREQLEKERIREIEEIKKEKEQQWRTHVEKLTSNQEKNLQERLTRLRRFREFQRKVLVGESGMEGRLAVNQLLPRM
ncbi:uncharacterized protein LOC120816923 [Gasterosteus aculeatus]|uniref:U2 small nuclear ribonucleoprotein auxiliary factor 35 kDa subunit-related protein 1-like n=1 Tax=Gasterosteus aculeatus aculeatus TaxID=481459 RepID=UPI001A998FF0|nr:U2 small nuclear ribonucleoprotein auxiliary factor 35 kDa subunit-related protein 1-like [Gasterosteus aculeatus aculeatus]XP_040028541.1 U2 small nuclear ribonucleoprotein auxiliary factor 35 kDa subunit-related protein 1-like [Gasterosteus aculeatus aculeatus]